MSVSFDVNEYESEGHKPFTAGWHTVQITDFGDDVNKAKTGEYVWFEFTVTDGPDKGRSFRNYYSYIHNNEETERISREQISTLSNVLELGPKLVLPDMLTQFNNKKLRTKIKQGKDDDFPNVVSVEQIVAGNGLGDSFSDLEDSAFSGQTQSNAPETTRDPFAS